MAEEREVAEDDDDIRLDRWFKRHFPAVPHAFIEKSLRRGFIRVDGKKLKSSDRVKAGQVIRIPQELEGDAGFKPKEKPVSEELAKTLQKAVLYRDAHVIAINKPAGLAVQGGSGIRESVDGGLEALKFDAKEKPKLVHRLDKDTSGVLLLARSAKAATVLAKAFASKDIEKYYWGLVIGIPKVPQGKIDMPLAKSALAKSGNMEHELVSVDEREGKRAITLYQIMDQLHKTLAWVEMQPVTGRTHQLRVHMAAIGHPLIGDGKYGGAEAFLSSMDLPKQLHLHARRIVVSDVFGKKLDITAPLPPHMKESWRQLGFSDKG